MLPRGNPFFRYNNWDRTRSCIWLKEGLDYRPLCQFCTKNIVSALVDVKLNGSSIEAVMCSAYCHGESEFPDALIGVSRQRKKY